MEKHYDVNAIEIVLLVKYISIGIKLIGNDFDLTKTWIVSYILCYIG